MITYTPGHSTLFTCCWSLISLTFNTQIHYVISTNSTIVYHNVPCPQSNSIPLLHFKSLLSSFWQIHWCLILVAAFTVCGWPYGRQCSEISTTVWTTYSKSIDIGGTRTITAVLVVQTVTSYLRFCKIKSEQFKLLNELKFIHTNDINCIKKSQH